ncbi:ATP-binding cassette domain-containing protein (plasmid) [Bacillus toyonensis]
MIEITNLNKIYKIRKRVSEGKFSVLKNFFSTQYNDINAVSDLSLYIKKGEIVGYIGTNGAGKSTTIKMMTGILNPTSGSYE